MIDHSVPISIRATRLGRGVFARKALVAEQVVGEIHGRLVDEPDYSSEYCVDLGGDLRLEPDEPFRLLNHSCEPNCELVLWKRRQVAGRRVSRVWLQTCRAIAAGEELTIDYAWSAGAAIPCGCQSRSCRGWIVAVHELPELLAALEPRETRAAELRNGG